MKRIRKTKIICTLGPSCEKPEVLEELLKAGMNIARLNFAHGSHDYHKLLVNNLRQASHKTKIPVAILADIKGPEIRTGAVAENKTILLKKDEEVVVTSEDVPTRPGLISLNYKNLASEITPGKHLRISDGLIDLEVLRIERGAIICVVRNGGELGSHKNVNIVGLKTNLPALTEKDIRDIMWSIENGVDFIAASFIRRPENVREIRSLIEVADAQIDIIAKIEDREGVDNIDEIIRVSDGIMVARGDLGVQLPAAEIPLVQKRIIAKCNASNKPVITSTQMLESMIRNPIPTRAEVTDIANAIFDGTDCIMLSGETASGLYPVEAVRIMHQVALETENSPEFRQRQESRYELEAKSNIADSVAKAAYLIAHEIGAQSILTPSLHGNTPRLVSRFRPAQTIIAVTPSPIIQRRLLIFWGVVPLIAKLTSDSDVMIENAIAQAVETTLIKDFDRVVILAGLPVDSPIMLNTIRVHLHCRVLAKSQRGYGGRISGRVVKVKSAEEALNRIRGTGDEILVTSYLSPDFTPVLSKIAGYILEKFSFMGFQEIERYHKEIVALAGTREALTILEDGAMITIDGQEKLIYSGKPAR